jgi:ribosomal protein S18 acetylase RimI-like enzyme
MLFRVWHQTYAPFLGEQRVNHLTEMWHQPAKLIQETTDGSCATFVAVDRRDVIGHVLAADEGEGRIHLMRLYLDSAYHGQGIGDRLLDSALSAFPNGKCVTLEVYEVNLRAVSFYKRRGFVVREKLRDEFASDELYEFRMWRAL